MLMEPIYVKCGRLVYKLSLPRYKQLLMSLKTGAGFSFESNELSSTIMLDLDMKNVCEEATFELRDLLAV